MMNIKEELKISKNDSNTALDQKIKHKFLSVYNGSGNIFKLDSSEEDTVRKIAYDYDIPCSFTQKETLDIMLLTSISNLMVFAIISYILFALDFSKIFQPYISNQDDYKLFCIIISGIFTLVMWIRSSYNDSKNKIFVNVRRNEWKVKLNDKYKS